MNAKCNICKGRLTQHCSELSYSLEGKRHYLHFCTECTKKLLEIFNEIKEK